MLCVVAIGGVDSKQQEGTTPMERRVRRAAQCAFAIQDALHNCELAEEVRLSVKIGIGMGKVSVLHLGGVYKRMEYIAVGEPLLQAFTAEHHATPGDVSPASFVPSADAIDPFLSYDVLEQEQMPLAVTCMVVRWVSALVARGDRAALASSRSFRCGAVLCCACLVTPRRPPCSMFFGDFIYYKPGDYFRPGPQAGKGALLDGGGIRR